MAKAVARDSPRNTFTGDACRSAIAPKMSGEMNAAIADAANAYGLIACIPCASNTVLSGTIHMDNAAPWKKNSMINSAYSALRMVRSTGRGDTERGQNSSLEGQPLADWPVCLGFGGRFH